MKNPYFISLFALSLTLSVNQIAVAADGKGQSAEPAAESAEAPSAVADVDYKIGILAAEIERLRLGEVAPTATVRRYGLGPAASKVYSGGEGVSLGGYGEMLYHNILGESGDARFDFYRAILYAGYKFNEHFVLNTEIEFEHIKEVVLEFAYLDFLWRDQLNLRAGLVLVPMGLINELHEPTTYLGALRPESERRILPSTWRENGIGVFGQVADFQYRAYLLSGFNAAGFSAAGLRGGRQKGAKALNDDWGGVLRVDWLGVDGVTVGGSAYYGGADQAQFAFNVSNLLYEVHADIDLRGWKVRGLYTGARVWGAGRLNAALGLTGADAVGKSMHGGYVQFGYDILRPFDSGDVALIPYLRFEKLDTQAAVTAAYERDPARRETIISVGASFLPMPQIVVKAEYQQSYDGANTRRNTFNSVVGYIF